MLEIEFISAINTLLNSETSKLSDEDKNNLITLRSRIEESIKNEKPFSEIDWGNAVDVVLKIMLFVLEVVHKK